MARPALNNVRKGPTPMIIQKMEAAIKLRGYTVNFVNNQLEASFQRVYRWIHNTGEPYASQVVPLARILDVSAVYLIDDTVAISPDPPRFIDPAVLATFKPIDESPPTASIAKSKKAKQNESIRSDILDASATLLDLRELIDGLLPKLIKAGRRRKD